MDSSGHDRAREVLEGNAWFARQPPAVRDALFKHGRVVRLAKGEWAFGEGDEETGLCAVVDGALRLEVAVESTRTVLINILSAGTVIGQSSRLGGGPRLVTARAARAAEIFRVSDRGLQAVCDQSAGAWRCLSELIYEQLASTIRMAAESTALPPRKRILAKLAMLAGDRCGAAGAVLLEVSQTDLAEMTGLSRKSVNRHLVTLAAERRVKLGYGRVVMLNRSPA